MDEIVYEALSRYYHALELKGYMSKSHSMKLLVLCFYWEFIFHGYHGQLSKKDYCLVEKALNCLYGTSCLIPYPDYLKMGKLHLGEMTEILNRLKTLEDAQVVKVMHDYVDTEDPQSDVAFIMEEDEEK